MDINIVLFQDFETLDVFGPVEILGHIEEFKLHFLSIDGGLIKSRQGTVIMTEPMADANSSHILLLPGGMGTRSLVKDERFVKELSKMAGSAAYCLTVCTGSALLAVTNLIDGKSATSNKRAFDWVKSVNQKVTWIERARWVVDGKYYTSSGVSAGMDMALGFVADRFGMDRAREIADSIEYIWNLKKEDDPFARKEDKNEV